MEQIAWTAEAACEIAGDLADRAQWPFPREISPELQTKINKYLKELF
jgi:hypothetical protein